MPEALHALLASEDESNKLEGVIPKLAQLFEHDKRSQVAYLCTDVVVQVSKIPCEGATFCCYRNIQMLALGAGLAAEGMNVLRMQDMIEKAWDEGHNPFGRVQTGGIRGTRKHVGTFEVEALLLSLGVPCTVKGYYGVGAQEELLDFVEGYFSSAEEAKIVNSLSRVRSTKKAPIYLQRPGHSLTIIGLEKMVNSKRRLLTLDPAWKPPSEMQTARLLPDSVTTHFLRRHWILWQYRKSCRYLRRFNAFETVHIA
ncbi:uncharacterized protein HMPREF1541_09723 [Cyphellophora europaea CBS 101466]|uniref:UFSP1/2/DUB catalytic domain-containing protein n=1 Tax=Cyphellophora europaea (strain CBS 101466) TaxID=1220924 RepID=W2S9Z3_CYPE1|nr:uncharacterized protein HMPREF1541_09723 [Cyphellophora europaea CBS 101466]ETN44848.1 hypothetical protein HMPREF1541_09723 [Cyphellophora europaea CBS 101466]